MWPILRGNLELQPSSSKIVPTLLVGFIFGTGEAMRLRRDCWERYHVGWWMVLVGASGLLWALLR